MQQKYATVLGNEKFEPTSGVIYLRKSIRTPTVISSIGFLDHGLLQLESAQLGIEDFSLEWKGLLWTSDKDADGSFSEYFHLQGYVVGPHIIDSFQYGFLENSVCNTRPLSTRNAEYLLTAPVIAQSLFGQILDAYHRDS